MNELQGLPEEMMPPSVSEKERHAEPGTSEDPVGKPQGTSGV